MSTGLEALAVDYLRATYESPPSGLVRRVVSGTVALSSGQGWYWTEPWQLGEREADADRDAERGELFDAATFLDQLGQRT